METAQNRVNQNTRRPFKKAKRSDLNQNAFCFNFYMLKYFNIKNNLAVMNNKKISVIFFLILILAVASFFRIWQLDAIPPALYPDMAMNGNNALDSLKNNDYKVFYADNNGREGLIIWIETLFFLIFGASVWSLKIVSSIFGILTVLGVYLLASQILKKFNEHYHFISLLASFFTAVSFWHILLSRIGFRAIMVPFFIVYGFYFLFKALDNMDFKKKASRIFNAAVSGIFFGLGFYTYISYRFVVLLGLIYFACWWIIYKKQNAQKEFFRIVLICLVFMFLTALPLGLYFLKNPGDFFGRAAGVSVLNDKNPLQALGKSVALTLGMFNFYGDSNWRHNFSGAPELLWPVGLFFLLGFALSVRDLYFSIREKNYLKVSCYILLLGWFFILLLPCFLSSEGIPHALRAIGVIPAVYIFAGIGSFAIYKFLKKSYRTKKQLIVFYCLIFLFLIILTGAELSRYFYEWGKNKEVYGAYNQDLVNLGNYVNSLPDSTQKYVIVNTGGVLVPLEGGIPMPAQTPIFIERLKYKEHRATYVKPEDIEIMVKSIDRKKDTTIILMNYNNDLGGKMISLFPLGIFEQKEGFWVFNISKESFNLEPLLPSATCGCNIIEN